MLTKTQRKINKMVLAADDETLRGYAEEWLTHVANQNIEVFEEEFQKYVDENED